MKTKIWGETEVLFETPFIEVSRIYVDANRFCSYHFHEYKYNAFFCLTGSIFVEVEGDIKRLNPGDYITVPPNTKHRFITGSRTAVALEIYYPEQLSEDIVRLYEGGKNVNQA